jgi:O-methyltransferase
MLINDRYLELLKSTLLNEIYIENDFRLLYLFTMLQTRQDIDPEVLRNVGSRLPDRFSRVKAARLEGRVWWMVGIKNPDGSGGVLLCA